MIYRYYYYVKYMFLTSLMWLIFFRLFFISRSTEILIILNFWLRVYTQNILNSQTMSTATLNFRENLKFKNNYTNMKYWYLVLLKKI